MEGITLINGDCWEFLDQLPDDSVDCVITDPPYAVKETHEAHLSNVILRDGEPARQALRFDGITEEDCVRLAETLCRKAKRWVVFTCEWHFMEALHRTGLLVRFGIWRKRNGAPQFTGDRPGMGWEAIAICHRKGKKSWNGGGKHAFYDVPKVDGRHPTEKPIALMTEFVLDFTNEGELVLDPFMGSGTTGEACVRTGRKFIGIEKDESYFRIAEERVANSQMPLLAT